MSAHRHAAQHVAVFDSGRKIAVCSCGATRVTDAAGRVESWHTCRLCTHPVGLP